MKKFKIKKILNQIVIKEENDWYADKKEEKTT